MDLTGLFCTIESRQNAEARHNIDAREIVGPYRTSLNDKSQTEHLGALQGQSKAQSRFRARYSHRGQGPRQALDIKMGLSSSPQKSG